MGNINKTKQAFWVGIGSFSTFLFTIAITAILARHLPKDELGTYRQILYVYNTLVIVFSAGLPNVFAYYLPKYELAEGKAIVNKINKILFICGLIFSLFLFLMADLFAVILNNDQLKSGLRYFAVIPVLLIPTLGIEGIFSSYQKTIYIAIYNISTRLFMLMAITFAVLIYGGSIENAILAWIISSSIALMLALYFKNLPFKNIAIKTPPLSLKEIFSYSIPIVLASLSGIALKAADQFYISRFFGPEIFAEFANGFVPLPFVGMITGAASTILMPIFSKLNQDKYAKDEIAILWKNTLVKSAYLIYPVVIFFIFYADPLVTIIYTDLYKNSVIYFRIALLLNFFHIIIFAPLLFSMGETKLYAQIHIFFAAIVWIGSFIIILIFNSPYYVAAFSITNNILLIIVSFIFTAKIFGLSLKKLIPFAELLKISLISVFSILITFTFLNIFSLSDQLIFLITGLLLYLIILFLAAQLFNVKYLNIIKPLFENKSYLKV